MDNQFNSVWASKIMRNEVISKTISEWVDAAKNKETAALAALLHHDVEFSPPFLDETVRGPKNTLQTLGLFSRTTKNFKYIRSWVSEDEAVLEFKAEIGTAVLHGLDLLEFDDKGQIVRFDVMARPHTAISLLRNAYLNSDLTMKF